MKKINSIIFSFLFLQLSVQAQFNICPQGSYNMGVLYAHAVNDQIYWASRRDVTGTIVTTDGGNTWSLSSFVDPKNYQIFCIHAFNADTAFVVASSIYKTTDRGTTWTAATGVFNNASSFANTIHFFDQNNGVAMGDPVEGYFEIYTTANGGVDWIRVPSSNIPAPLSGETGLVNEHSYYNNSYWFGTTKQRVFRSTDRGHTWTCSQLTPASASATVIPSVAFRDELHGLAISINAAGLLFISRTSDGGSKWIDDSIVSWIWGIATIAYIPGTQSTYTITTISFSGNELKKMILFTKDDGLTWKRMDDWGPWLNDILSYHQWTSVNSGWGSILSGNVGSIYHWPGYSGKHIWRAASHLNFRTRDLTSSDEIIEISVGNYGTEALTINSFTLSSSQYVLVNSPTVPLTLQPWDAVDISISFSPKNRGLFNDSLVILSDAANYNSISTSLTGRALEFTPLLPNLIYAASDSLYNCSPSNLTAVPVGWFDGTQIEGLTISPVDSVLMGISTSMGSSILYKIDPIVGGCLQKITIPIGNMRAIAYGPSGTLYSAQKNGALCKINTITGEVTTIGTPSGKVYSSLAFNPKDGKLYASVSPVLGSSKDAIYTIDTLTGIPTLLGLTGDGKGTPSIAFNLDGTLYGLKGTGTAINKLITIDKTNGHGTEIGSLGKSGLQTIIMSELITGINENTKDFSLTSYELFQNYPNPFNSTSMIKYSIPKSSQVKLKVFTTLGEELETLVNEEKPAGNYELTWNAANLPSGIYFYRIQAGSFVETKKMVLLK